MDLLLPRPIASFVIAPADRLDTFVRCSPPGFGYSSMKPAEGVDCLLDQPLHLTGISNIRAHKKALAACLGPQFEGLCTSVVDVADHDFGAMFRKRERSRRA